MNFNRLLQEKKFLQKIWVVHHYIVKYQEFQIILLMAAGVLAQVEKTNKKRRGIEWTEEEEKRFKSKVVEAYEREGSPYYSTARDDGVIDLADTRKVLGLCLMASAKDVPPETKYGVFRM